MASNNYHNPFHTTVTTAYPSTASNTNTITFTTSSTSWNDTATSSWREYSSYRVTEKTDSQMLRPANLCELVRDAQKKSTVDNLAREEADRLLKDTFSSPKLCIEGICKTAFDNQAGHQWHLPTAEPSALIDGLNRLMVRSIFAQVDTRIKRSIHDGSVIQETIEDHPAWIIASPKVVRSLSDNLNDIDDYSLQLVRRISHRIPNYYGSTLATISLYGSRDVEDEGEFLIAGSPGQIKFSYGIPFTVINGMVAAHVFFTVSQDVKIYTAIEV
jgi:hypothetical protein